MTTYHSEPHLNPSSQTPPVGCPLLIELHNGELVRAERRRWAENHSAQLEFHGAGIGYWGRYDWTYP